MLRTAVLGLTILAAGCLASTPSARVQAEPPAADRLAGAWSGTYVVESGPGSGGALSFTLEQRDADVVAGPVMIRPAAASDEYLPAAAGDLPSVPAAAARGPSLTIRLLTASDGLIYGDTDTFRDAARGVDAIMTLRGELEKDEIRGTFRTTYTDGSAQTLGRWTVTRANNGS